MWEIQQCWNVVYQEIPTMMISIGMGTGSLNLSLRNFPIYTTIMIIMEVSKSATLVLWSCTKTFSKVWKQKLIWLYKNKYFKNKTILSVFTNPLFPYNDPIALDKRKARMCVSCHYIFTHCWATVQTIFMHYKEKTKYPPLLNRHPNCMLFYGREK